MKESSTGGDHSPENKRVHSWNFLLLFEGGFTLSTSRRVCDTVEASKTYILKFAMSTPCWEVPSLLYVFLVTTMKEHILLEFLMSSVDSFGIK